MPDARDIGIDVEPPEGSCDDPNCPFHGTLPVRGTILEGKVVSTAPAKSAVVEREYLHRVPKYERYEKRSSRYTVHCPPCMDPQPGDEATIMECRPLSKTKTYAIIEVRERGPEIVVEDYTEAEDLEIETAEDEEDEEAEEDEDEELPPEAQLGGDEE